MTYLRPGAVEQVIIMIALIMIVGGTASILLTQNPDWMSLHLSRLGEGGHLSSYIFNATAAFSGLAMLELAVRIVQLNGWRKIDSAAARRAKIAVGVALRLIAICLVGLAIFPYDKFVAVHNTFGYGMTTIYLLLVAYTTYCLPLFGRTFKIATSLFLAITLGLFTFYFVFNGRQITLLQIQILGLTYFYAWSVYLTVVLQKRLHRARLN